MTYELIIIGGGPAGVSAGVYSARKKLKTLLITPDFGGQSTVSEGIENWIGTIKISGNDLAKNLKNHLLAYSGESLEIKEGEAVQDIRKDGEKLIVITEKEEYHTQTILIATGSTRRKLDVPGAKEYDNRGLIYCASCDGPLFAGQDVAVIGGGNAAFESAAQLLAYCKSVTLLNRSDRFRADEITVKKVLSHPNMKVLNNSEIIEVQGGKFVDGLYYRNKITGERDRLKVSGIFVEIGLIPTTDFAKNIIKLNEIGQIPTDPRTQQTSILGIWAAGDCTDGLYHQNNIASGDAVKALEDIYITLRAK
ncbi:MAG: hypothetical protein A2566_01515 [Candidatus Zambryskibacteria bacterium RIFOXYD1_FULL_40_13]|nr:MAG: Alkyl hydroperoxide reductase [Parcubacteria group bacterium GW2011_GWC1_39_12]KKR19528.1 MAG: Alkyl hydroperoxide reductase [Parcubacteria group bacterium GW2011_GWF1_39_37]KKR35681.1 MAG: Alkyl hydroperoxide reductase [Parcubacteria group bacterium GW2011_GWC2_40_10]KKR52496.1 MAG: Alkyl hydroperoxide reductase [Parcubacteria group bacterium GW2011_GWE1_40_20]KKR65489.1 MAG: Alkyl hydroperoxide reductase [Parcubacteria group bacterium GW2011_GWB1_40_5]KKR68944.1 MAG: Alkyl hydroperox